MLKDLPKPQENTFMYEMMLLLTAMDMHLFKDIPVKSLDVEELSSLLATLIVESLYKSQKTKENVT